MRTIPFFLQNSAILGVSKAMCPPMWTRKTAARSCSLAAFSTASKLRHRSARLQSPKTTSPPAFLTARGVAMKVLVGTKTLRPFTM